VFQSTRAPRCAPHSFEALEGRRLLSTTFVIDGSNAADTIRIRQSGSTVTVTRNGSSTSRTDVSGVVVNGNGGNDYIAADGSVRVPLVLRGGSGNDTLAGGAGDDVLVSVGGSSDHDRLTGNGGHDNFWTDGGSIDKITDRSGSDFAHLVGSFMTLRVKRSDGSFSKTPVPLTLSGQRLPDPVATKAIRGWKNFSGQPLFPAGGPSEQDVDQNAANDCYFLAPLSSVAKLAPDRLTDRIVDLGDGTYAVQFEQSGSHYFVRVDGDLPVTASGAPFYAGLGRQGSIWAPIVEKAWAFFRRGKGTYASINWGGLSEFYDAVAMGGATRQFDPVRFNPGGGILEAIDGLLDDGYSVVYSTKNTQPAGSKLRPDHVVMVDRVLRNRFGVASGVVLRDQYKRDKPGAVDGADDGYITLSAAQASAWMEAIAWCKV
jgi:hypothetical protein